jgi:anaerobic dimethyl sulfoxide reductase subunit A
MIVSLASNVLINQHGDINRTAALLRDPSRCEFIVCSDLFMTASARYADILLPGASVFEMDNITFPWKYGDFLGYCNQIIDPVGEARPEYDWLSEVAYKLGYGDAFTQGRTGAEWLEAIYEDLRQTEQELPSYRTFQQEGIYRYQENSSRIAFEQEVKDPVRHPFPTASGRIEIFSSRLYQDQQQGRGPDTIPPIPGYTAPEEGPQDPLTARYPLQLIGWHTRRRCHSIHDNNEQLRAQDPQQLWMHPADAAARQITDGEEVLVWNDRGKMQIPVKVTDRIMRGVTALAQGAWYQPDENGTDHGGCINVLTSQKITGYAKGNPQHSNLVEVGKIQRPV